MTRNRERQAADDGKAAADPLAEILNIAVVSHEHRLAAEADLEERLYTVLKYKDTEITKLDRDSRSLLKKIRTAAETWLIRSKNSLKMPTARSTPRCVLVLAPGKWPKKLNLFSMVRARISVSTTANFRCGV